MDAMYSTIPKVTFHEDNMRGDCYKVTLYRKIRGDHLSLTKYFNDKDFVDYTIHGLYHDF
jgi:hypothetical protein